MRNYIPDYNLEPNPAPKYPSCPVCDSDMYSYIVEDKWGFVVGCSECVDEKSPEDYMEELANEEN